MTTAFVAGYLGFLIWRGFFVRRIGFATWHMFAGAPYCRFELRVEKDGRQQTFNPWDYLPRDHTVMSRRELDFFLLYLRRVHQVDVVGLVHVREGNRCETLRVRATRVWN